jgi:hypothetical protein
LSKSGGDVKVELKSTWPDGTTALILSPLEMIEKLAALVPYPHKNLVIYSGCLAPNHKARVDIVPAKPASKNEEVGTASPTSRKRYIPWSDLMKKTWGIDVFTCRGSVG